MDTPTLIIRVELAPDDRALLEQLTDALRSRPAPLAAAVAAGHPSALPARPQHLSAVPDGSTRLIGVAQREVLTWLVDHHGRIDRAHGDCTSFMAAELDMRPNHCSGVLKVLAERGHVERDITGKRTHSIRITDSGRALLGPGTVTAIRSPKSPRATAPEEPEPPKPTFPEPGPIGPLGHVDEDQARDLAATAAITTGAS